MKGQAGYVSPGDIQSSCCSNDRSSHWRLCRVFAADVTVQAVVDKQSVFLGEAITLQVQIDGAEKPDSALDTFGTAGFPRSGHRRRRQQQLFNKHCERPDDEVGAQGLCV